jgi:transketolase
MFSPAAKEMAAKLGLKQGRANLDEFAATLLDLARGNPNIIAVTSDSRGSGKLGPFGQALPKQIVEVGIAEQNLVGITSGLAAAGKKVFGVSPACFLTTRALEQFKNDVCYSDVPAVLVGISAGVSYGALGSTHHSLHDLAALRAIHNLTIIVPADNFETREAVHAAAHATHPVYLRFGKAPTYSVHHDGACFEVGKAIALTVTCSAPHSGKPSCDLEQPGGAGDSLGGSQSEQTPLSSGCGRSLGEKTHPTGGEGERSLSNVTDIAFIATGETVVHCLLAAGLLAERGLTSRVLSMHTIKPLDTESILRAARECSALIVAEEHSIHGGLGEACAATILKAGVSLPFHIAGIPDEDTVTGSQADIFRHYGLTMEALADSALKLLAHSTNKIRNPNDDIRNKSEIPNPKSGRMLRP